jgi:hypothetical protein
MCFSGTKSFCFKFSLQAGTKLCIILDVLFFLEYITIYLVFIFCPFSKFSEILKLIVEFDDNKPDLTPDEIQIGYDLATNYMSISYIYVGMLVLKFYKGYYLWRDGFRRKQLEDYFIISLTFFFSLFI